MQKSWSWTTPPQSPYKRFVQEHPNFRAVHGHVASPAYLLNVSRRLREILTYSVFTEVSLIAIPSFDNCKVYILDAMERS